MTYRPLRPRLSVLALCVLLSFSVITSLMTPAQGAPSEPSPAEPSPATHAPRQGPLTPDPFLARLFEVAAEVPSKAARRALKEVLSDPARFHFQLIVTELDPQTGALTPHEYRVDRDYIYPASAVKTFGSLASLMYLHELSSQEGRAWIEPRSPLSFHPKRCERSAKNNLSSGLMTLEHEVKQTQLVSSNRAFNHVLDIVGSERLHDYLLPLFPSLRVYHRLSTNETHQESLTVPPLTICAAPPKGSKRPPKSPRLTLRARAQTLSDQNAPTTLSSAPYTGYGPSLKALSVGEAYIDPKSKKFTQSPMDFTWKNRVSLYDFQRLMFALYAPERSHEAFGLSVSLKRAPSIPSPWLNMLRGAMVTYPHDSKDPQYRGRALSETRFKPLIRGVRMSSEQVNAEGEGRGLVADRNLYYMNKAGKALGFHIDNALIAIGPGELKLKRDYTPHALKRAAFITVGLYVNQDQTLNDNRYEYKTVSVPLFDALGYAIGRYLQGTI